MMFAFALASLIAYGSEILDLDMSAQERKKTGVYKLTAKEKAALQQWIDSHYEKRSEPLTAAGEEGRSELMENIHDGQYIRLNNGTLWQIHPKDTNVSFGWITAVDIIVTKSQDPDYPYKLTNSLTGSSVRARKVDAVDSSTGKKP